MYEATVHLKYEGTIKLQEYQFTFEELFEQICRIILSYVSYVCGHSKRWKEKYF